MEREHGWGVEFVGPELGALARSIAVSVTVVLGWGAVLLMYAAFAASHFGLAQNLAVGTVATLAAVGALAVTWISFGLRAAAAGWAL